EADVGSLDEVPRDVLVNVFVTTTNGRAVIPAEEREPVGDTASRGQLKTMTLRLSELERVSTAPNVTHLEIGEPLARPRPIVHTSDPAEPKPHKFEYEDRHRYGAGVLIGIVDVGGFDFAHDEFIADGKTRWVRIWDQGTEGRAPSFRDFSPGYGNELTADDMNAAIEASGKYRAPATALEPQSQMQPGSHGTHVAGIAAGAHGVCRNATIAGVLIDIPDAELRDLRRSFYDSTRIAHAVEYLVELSKELKLPLSINISLGTNGHAHDASAALSRWLDNAMNLPGRCVSVAAGNAGQEKAEHENDLGYVMGRIHTSGRIPSRGLGTDIDWIVVGDGRADVSDNELEIWYSAQDRFSVELRPPGGEWIKAVAPGEYIQNHQLPDRSLISIYNELYHPANGANYIAIYLSPFYSDKGCVPIAAGLWTVRLSGIEVRDGRYHGWIERDDPRPKGRADTRELWSFPSFFSERSNVDESSVSSLACGMRVLAVANLDYERDRINVTSSQGPTRDGRFKPDVAAPGTKIVAANGFAGSKRKWIAMTGTSMASPYVCGVAALMLAINPELTAAQIEGIVESTSRPLPGASYEWINDAGFGRINAAACIEKTLTINERKKLVP
ncbi:MAG TPA: S8 family serine peptidase, partial [Thermoanaerobaculia bacterium]|nr:S8 family serine peptidase [Thermoanaerobaculia bacterium]